jgi:catechol 2,3-dioxygenase-like lactoylglutathione lyase family enzyme
MSSTVESTATRTSAGEAELGPPKFDSLAHVSLPCRDLDEGIAFYVDVLGGELRALGPIFASVRLAGANVGFGTKGASFIEDSAEYPHIAFYVGPEQLLHTQRWLAQCEIPTSNLWTRRGKEVLMFFRDPSGNVIELFCKSGFKDADKLPVGTSAGHGQAVNIDALRYTTWKRPKVQQSRVVVRDK